jgi:predicted HAD superfamily Cof-like phosphohydrolase
MESSLLTLVKNMHRKFGLENASGPTQLTTEEKQFRIAALREEIQEYEDADNLVKQYDALLDLLVFAVGTLERQGLPLLKGFEAVMEANMAKELGQNGSKRGGFKRDLVKPEGWTGPENKLAVILNNETALAVNSHEALTFHPITPSSDGAIVSGFAPKFDNYKVRVDLLPIYPMTAIAEVFAFGASKYFANSYRQGETVAWSRTYGSILRHLFAFWSGDNIDPESGKSHLAHAGTQLMILMEHTKHNQNKDDRFKREAA